MLNLGIDPLHLQPRDGLEQLRRASLFHPRPAGNTQNEQYARALLHARNEADIGASAGDAANEPDGRSTDSRIDTHWTRILHYDVFGANGNAEPGAEWRRNEIDAGKAGAAQQPMAADPASAGDADGRQEQVGKPAKHRAREPGAGPSHRRSGRRRG